MFRDVAILVVIAAARWHQARHHDQQVAAAHQALAYLQTAYEHAAASPLAALAQHKPPAHTVERHAQHLRAVLPDHAEQVLDDPAWPALAAALAQAETAGHDPRQLLQHAADQRALDDARSTARTLTWRIQRLGERHAPGPRAQAPNAHHAVVHSAAPQEPQARRR
ncbi:hypothetical protein M2271_006145 [Streptomyces sp. LBL]|nr:hypothetical protein [Streptomyces sp. LBL]